MRPKTFTLLCLQIFLAFGGPALGQDIGRVSPAALPLPLPSARPVPPDVLRSLNPWILPMTGTWKFALTHGAIKAGKFVPGEGERFGISASSYEDKNPPNNAFDGSDDTRWCASDDGVPQWLQTDLGSNQTVTGVNITWEHGGGYECRIEGKRDGGQWVTLGDESAAPGIGNGPVAITPAEVRFVRITIVGHSAGSWASIREFQVHLAPGGQDVVWQPLAQKPPAIPVVATDEFAATTFDDASWDALPVPSNWEMYGYSVPTYGSVDDTVGQYRRWVQVPASWAGRNIYWHFDGVLDGAEVYINGQKAGYHESGYTAWNIDLTGLVKPGEPNLFAVRVSKSVPSYDCETGDFQCMGGIYRDTSLIAVPPTHVSDIIVRTPLDSNYVNATLYTTVHVAGTPGEPVSIRGNLFAAKTPAATGVRFSGEGSIGPDGTSTIDLSAPVSAPALWSAEKPNLYYVVLQLSRGGKTVERVEQRFGFKQIDFTNNMVLWNGRPIKCTGTCRHDYWADKGFALTETNWEEDLALMKAANINAIRTSHYNHAQRFLELCEERGMYILDEIPYCWINDQVNDPAYAPYLLQRATETLARDENRPCVLAWSIGNENPMGRDSQDVIDLVRATDPTRPAFVSCNSPGDVKGQLWEDDHYPDPRKVDDLIKHGTPANFSENPHIFWQPESEDYDPGTHDLWSEALGHVWSKVWTAPTILGSFIWEWQNQGIADKDAPAPHEGPWGPDNLRQENDKGIVTAYRVPKPEWWFVKQVYSPIQVDTRPLSASGDSFSVRITNRYSFTDLSEFACHWTAYQGDTVLESGFRHLTCPPADSTAALFPAPAGVTKLRLEFDHADGTSVVAVNLAVAGAPVPQPPAAIAAGGALMSQDSADTLRVADSLQEVIFNKRTGTIQSWRVQGKDIVIGGPILNLGEAKAGDERSFYRASNPPVTDGVKITASPADASDTIRVSVSANVLTKAGGSTLGTLTSTYDIKSDAEVTVNWKVDWGSNSTNLWEEGLRISVPPTMTHMRWFRDSYFTDYPSGHIGEPSGDCLADNIQFRASKRNLHWLSLTDNVGNGVVLLPVAGTPLTGRANSSGTDDIILFASREVAGPRDFSGSWVSDHNIRAREGKPLSVAFTLRSIVSNPASPAMAYSAWK
jgi:beta-galactosidase